MAFGFSMRDGLGLALAAGGVYVITGLLFAVRKALARSREAAAMTEGDPARCPHCGFRYAFDGERCGHCWRRAHDYRFLWAILFWPAELWRRAARRIRQVIADRHAEPENSHPGIIVPPGTPIAKAVRDSQLRETLEEQEPDNLGVQKDPLPIGDVLSEVFKEIQELHDLRRPTRSVSTGFYELDDLLVGLEPGRLFVVAGRPSMGKTSFALGIAANVGIGAEKSVLYFSTEHSAGQLVRAILCSHARMDSQRLRTGKTTEEEYMRLVVGAGALHERQIFFEDSWTLSIDDVREQAWELASRKKVDLIIVDDILGIRPAEPEEPQSRVQGVRSVSRGLKAMARDLDVPVIVVAPVNRAAEWRPGRRPLLPDLKDAGALEEEADVVMLLFRDEYYTVDSDRKGVCEVIVAKNRMGPTGMVELAFLREFTRFENLTRPLGNGS